MNIFSNLTNISSYQSLKTQGNTKLGIANWVQNKGFLSMFYIAREHLLGDIWYMYT